ncbi:unnamed protein product [Gulo gulo]|uniref:Uncharacterized protein n=1 Tax=Gulo gulo TaxID=48420 RepID=A0A9X9LI96_GULGU|nr:unnamed protein product [Gulo gulo]
MPTSWFSSSGHFASLYLQHLSGPSLPPHLPLAPSPSLLPRTSLPAQAHHAHLSPYPGSVPTPARRPGGPAPTPLRGHQLLTALRVMLLLLREPPTRLR